MCGAAGLAVVSVFGYFRICASTGPPVGSPLLQEYYVVGGNHLARTVCSPVD